MYTDTPTTARKRRPLLDAVMGVWCAWVSWRRRRRQRALDAAVRRGVGVAHERDRRDGRGHEIYKGGAGWPAPPARHR